ncbi:14883_t:CDS:2 [Funneliformis mosseae]|uniref:14883_t:CDS:1 n=1 Tax=Funneliformis mosseae TaxID=27381 RepID=A0A9N8W4N9_FUNMO|nr:14883_t:CDS:2 [Funneliformis mosseae]
MSSPQKYNRYFGKYEIRSCSGAQYISGILVSCIKTKESLCISEFYDFLYADKFYNSTDDNPKVDEGGSNKDDVETSIAKEIAQMKQPHKSRRFASIQTGANCDNPPVNPVQLVHSILTDLYNSEQRKLGNEILKPRFYSLKDDQQKIIGHNHNVDRMELITMIAKLVDQRICICGMSILEDYNKLKKYNIKKIFEELNEKKTSSYRYLEIQSASPLSLLS